MPCAVSRNATPSAVNKNWRITFGWDEDAAIAVDLEDYH